MHSPEHAPHQLNQDQFHLLHTFNFNFLDLRGFDSQRNLAGCFLAMCRAPSWSQNGGRFIRKAELRGWKQGRISQWYEECVSTCAHLYTIHTSVLAVSVFPPCLPISPPFPLIPPHFTPFFIIFPGCGMTGKPFPLRPPYKFTHQTHGTPLFWTVLVKSLPTGCPPESGGARCLRKGWKCIFVFLLHFKKVQNH